MKLDRNEIFIWKVFFTPTSDWSLCLLWQDVWCSEYWGLSQVKFPCKEPFMLYQGTIFLNSYPFMELIARKRILNRVNKSSEFQWKFTKLSHHANLGLGFLLLRKNNVELETISTHRKFISKAGKVNFHSKKSYRFCWEILAVLYTTLNYIRNKTQSIHTIFNSLKEHPIHRAISLCCCE